MSVNDFKRGAEAHARVHYAFMRKQGEATGTIGKRIVKKIDELGNIVDVLVDELNQQEMDHVFGVYSSLDIGTLERSDQIKLLSYLKALTTRCGQTTPQQQDYFFAVKKYLNIGNVTDTIRFEAVSELDLSRSELTAFLECICEFLFLNQGSRAFVVEFGQELDWFGLSDKIVNKIVSTIETTYTFFGVRGIIEHYSLEPLKHEEEPEKHLRIPFFEKSFAIIYNGKEKHHGAYAEMLKSTIEEQMSGLGLNTPQIMLADENTLLASEQRMFEETRHIIFIGTPKFAKNLASIMKWDFNNYGMQFGTSGEKSIITVSQLRKKDIQGFTEYVKQNKSRWETDSAKTVQLLKQNFIKDCFDKDEPAIVNILATMIGWPLLLVGGIADIFSHAELKEDLIKFQYFVAIDRYVSSKIDSYIEARK